MPEDQELSFTCIFLWELHQECLPCCSMAPHE